MGILLNLYNNHVLQEVEKTVNGKTEDLNAGDENSTTDYTDGEDDKLNLPDEDENEEETSENDQEEGSDDEDTTEDQEESDNNNDDSTDENAEEDEEQEEQDEEEPTDYTQGEDEALNGDSEDENQEEGSDDESQDDSQQSSSIGNKSDLQNLELDLFSNLTPEQINIKHKELKAQYVKLYADTESIIDRLGNIPKTVQNMPVLNFVTEKIIDLRKLINYYLTEVYSTKTYTENSINYQQYLVVLNSINNILKELISKK